MAPGLPGRRVRTDVTGLLRAWSAGDESALEALMPIVHGELHRLARRLMRGERSEHTLQTTAIVNEAGPLSPAGRVQSRCRADRPGR